MNITNYTYIQIERTKGASVLLNNRIDATIVDKLLIEALPSGSPTDKFYKLLNIKQHIYLCVLHILDDKDYGLCLVIELANDLAAMNPIGFVDSAYKHLEQVIKDINNLPKTLDLTYNEIQPEFQEYSDFDSVIFSLFTMQKTIVVGEHEELQKVMGTILECIPPELRGLISFAANMTNISSDEKISLVPISERILRALDSRKEDYTVLLLPLKQSFGKYTAPICKKIAQLYRQEKCESIKDEIGYLFKLAAESKELETIADFAAKHDMGIADASLIMWIRANYYDLEMQHSFLEQIGN
jgi:hypothetical protein